MKRLYFININSLTDAPKMSQFNCEEKILHQICIKDILNYYHRCFFFAFFLNQIKITNKNDKSFIFNKVRKNSKS